MQWHPHTARIVSNLARVFCSVLKLETVELYGETKTIRTFAHECQRTDPSCGRTAHHIFIHSYLIQTVCTKVLPYHFYIHVYYVWWDCWAQPSTFCVVWCEPFHLAPLLCLQKWINGVGNWHAVDETKTTRPSATDHTPLSAKWLSLLVIFTIRPFGPLRV